MKLMRVAIIAVWSAFSAMAQEVTLTSHEGEVEITGALLGFDGRFYRVDTVYGELTVDSALARCSGEGCPEETDFVPEILVSGSASMSTILVPALLEGFARRDGYKISRHVQDRSHVSYRLTSASSDKALAVFKFRATNSDEGFADLLANEADLVMSRRAVTAMEQARAQDAGMGDLTTALRARVLARDALVPIVSTENPIDAITPSQLALILAGEITNWSTIGGPDAPITLHVPEASDELGQFVEATIMKPVGLSIVTTARSHGTIEALSGAVQDDPSALGLASLATLDAARPLGLLGDCGQVLRATPRSIKTDDYPLSAPMFVYTPARRLPDVARDFLVFLDGPAAQIIIRRAGYVDQAPEEIPVDQQGDRFANAISQAGEGISLADLQQLVERIVPMNRLSMSFRFEPDTAQLNPQSRANVLRLARDLQLGLFDARQIQFLGFSDEAGVETQNRQDAPAQAALVRDAILEAAGDWDSERTDISVDAFGEAMPLFCDGSYWGRNTNNRVEVWVR